LTLVDGTSGRERAAVWAIAGAAGVGAARADTTAVDHAVADPVLAAAFGVVVALATSRASHWTWFWLVGVASLLVPQSPLGAAALLVALVVSFVALRQDRHLRLLGAVVGALVVQGLLRSDPVLFDGFATLGAAVAVAPVLVFAARAGLEPRRRDLKRTP